jgi:dUTP pyrophosphatase
MLLQIEIPIKVLANGNDLPLPSYQTSGSAGMDLYAATEATLTARGGRALIATGFAMAIPQGYEAQIRPRSGLAHKYGVTCLNSPGTIDSDYRGEVKVLLINHGEADFKVERQMRIAQLIIAPITRGLWIEQDNLEDTTRGEGGFGSTGK